MIELQQIIYKNMEQNASDWVPNNSADVNPIPAVISAVNASDGFMQVTYTATKAEGGALISRTLPFPPGGAAYPYIGLDLKRRVSSSSLAFLAQLENDMILTAIDQSQVTNPALLKPSWVPGSTQRNFASLGGAWEIDPAWTQTGFAGAPVIPDAWMPLSLRGYVDWTNEVFSMLSINDNGTLFTVPASLQKAPLKPEKWAAVIDIQLQAEVNAPGTVIIDYVDVNFTMSSGAF